MRNKHILAGAALAALGFIAAPAFAANLVNNGSFEQNTGNGTCATGWTCNYSGNYFGEETVSFWNAQQGGSNLATSPDGGNVLATWYVDAGMTISQTLSGLTAGNTYTLSFDEASADRAGTYYGPGKIGWQVSVGGTTLGNANVQVPGANSSTAWVVSSYTFVASASSEVLQFLSESTVPVAPEPILLLDGVKVQPQVAPVPEPSTWALTVAGLVAIGGFARRRQRNASQA